MTYNEKLLNRVREALADQKDLEEKKMFGGICFMIDDKMCIGVNKEEMLCRIGPDEVDAALEHSGVREMVMGDRVAKGYVYISEEAMKTKKQFDHWIELCLAFNKFAKSSKGKKSKK
jgi:TfoX/Sxy family transcriptional regulator of competence genes